MKVHGHPWSINTRKTLMTLAEKGAEAELVVVDLPKGAHLTPAHRTLHPFAKIPILDDGGFRVYETRAINRYLDARLDGADLWPTDPQAAARADQWLGVCEAYFAPHAHPMLVELLFRPYLGGDADTALIENSRAAVQPALDAVEGQLASNPYLAGDRFSLADVHWMPYLDYLVRVGEGRLVTERANLRAWWDRIVARPAWRKVAHSGPQPDQPRA